MRFHRLLTAALLAASLAPIAVGQAIQMAAPKVVSSLQPWTSNNDETRDVALDSLGNRYAVGTLAVSGGVDSFVTKFNRFGIHQWTQLITTGTNTAARTVAVDPVSNDVYVALTVDNIETLNRYTPAGAMLWTVPFGTGTMHDMAVDATGNVVTVGQHIQSGTSYSSLLLWASDGSGFIDGWIYNGGGIFSSLIIDGTGRIFASGYNDSTATAKSDVIVAQVSPDWTATNGYLFGGGDTTWDDQVFSMALDPNGMLVFGGNSRNPSTGEVQAFIGTMNFTTDVGYYSRFADTGGSAVTDVATAPDGMIYLCVTSDFASGDPFGYILAETKDPADDWFVDVWYDEFGSVTAGQGLWTYNAEILPNNRLSLACLDGSLVGGSYEAYNLLTWAADGTRLQRTVLGSGAAPIPTTYDPVYWARFAQNVVYGQNYWSMFAPAQGSAGTKAAFWNGQFREGPDDVVLAKEDTPLVLTTANSILKNDPNGWDLVNPNKARLVPGSASAGIATLLVRPNGTVEATFDPNFFGNATFQYELRRNLVVISTQTVTLQVAPVKDAPVAVNDSYHVPKNSPYVTLDVLANDSDADGDDFFILSKTNPVNGRLVISTDKKSLSYKPFFGWTGSESFTYTIKDASGLKSTATVTVTVP